MPLLHSEAVTEEGRVLKSHCCLRKSLLKMIFLLEELPGCGPGCYCSATPRGIGLT